MKTLTGCPGCGLYLGHVTGCRGVVAVYMRYYSQNEQDGFASIEEAEAFLSHGEDDGSLSSVRVELPDGTVVRDRESLGFDWP